VLDVDLAPAREADDAVMPARDTDLNRFWHYKVLHRSFVVYVALDLTVDDSDEDIFNGRNAFIRERPQRKGSVVSNAGRTARVRPFNSSARRCDPPGPRGHRASDASSGG